jgi:type IV secretory pathway VirB9-like protein
MKVAASLKQIVFACAAFVVSAPATQVQAQQTATPVNGDTRLVTFDFDPDVTYLVLTRLKSVTNIMLTPGEKVISLVSGDTVNFTFQVSASREHIFIKPKFEGMTTSASLETSKAVYQFMIRSVGENAKWHQRVTWNNPDMVLVDVAASQAPAQLIARPAVPVDRVERSDLSPSAQAGLPIDRLNFDYQSTGDEKLRPSAVFDDSIRTYFRMPVDLQEMPALFGVKDNEASLVNYTVKNGYLIAQGVDGSYVFKLGRQEVQIRKTVKRSFFGTMINGN